MATITFWGATGTVTGSRHFLELDRKRYLVDCGLFQGTKENRLRNWEEFPIDPGQIERVLLTHAHIDHTGYLPRLVKNGFSGPVHCTRASADLLEILLRDSAHLQAEDARWANKRGFSKHKPAKPLYELEDAERALSLFMPVFYGQDLPLSEGVRAKFKDAGHILGSAFIDIKTSREGRVRKILFGGDLGRPHRPVLRDPAQVFDVDYLVLESTYGNRLHPRNSPKEELAELINQSVDRGGVLLVPAFAVGRTQTLLFVIRELEEQGKIPELQVFVDSPMAIDSTEIFRNHLPDLDLQSRLYHLQGKQIFRPKRLRICRSRNESKKINAVKNRAIIISSSGMAAGGRILHHLTERLPDPANTVLFIGYQAEGTRGRQLVEGAKKVKIHGQYVPVKALVETLSGYSGHADYQEILAWLIGFNRPPEQTFIVHGEPDAAESLSDKIRETLGWNVLIPKLGESFELDL